MPLNLTDQQLVRVLARDEASDESLRAYLRGGFGSLMLVALTELARRRGLILVRNDYYAEFDPVGAVSQASLKIIPDASLGPFFLPKLVMAVGGVDTRLTALKSGSRQLTLGDGILINGPAWAFLNSGLTTAELSSPVIVHRSDVLQLTIEPNGGTLVAGNALYAAGWHCRKPGGGLPGKEADLFAEDVHRYMGELFMANLSLSGTGDNDGIVMPQPTRWRKLAVGDSTGGYAIDLRWRIGNIDVFPQGIRQGAAASGGVLQVPIILDVDMMQAQGERQEGRLTSSAAGYSVELYSIGSRYLQSSDGSFTT